MPTCPNHLRRAGLLALLTALAAAPAAFAADPPASGPKEAKPMKLHGTVTDFDGQPLAGAEIRVEGRGFKTDVAYATADNQGRYEVEVPAGLYLCVWICRDYKEKNLEYWAWHVPIEGDLEMNARVGGLEVYGLNAFWPKYGSGLMIYFRPMSLSRSLAWEKGDQPVGLIDIAPHLRPEDVEITLDGAPAPLMGLQKVREETPPNYMDAHLAQIRAPGVRDTGAYHKITVALRDRETDERGEGTVFVRFEQYAEGPIPVRSD